MSPADPQPSPTADRPPWRRLRDLAETVGAQAVTSVVALVVSLATARELGPKGRGEYVEVIIWAVGIGTLVNLSLGQLVQRRIQLAQRDWRVRTQMSAVILFLASAGAGMAVVVAAVALGLTPAWMRQPALALPLLCMIPVQSWNELGPKLFSALQRLGLFNFWSACSQAVALLATLGYLWGLHGRSVPALLDLYAAGIAVLPLATGAVLVRQLVWPGVRSIAGECGALLHGATRLHPNTVATLACLRGPSLVVSLIAPPAVLAIFQLGYQLVSALFVLPNAAALVMYGELARMDPDQAWARQRHFVAALMLAFAGVCALGWFLLSPVVSVFAGPRYAEAITIGRWLLPAMWAGTLPALLIPQWVARGFFKVASATTVVMASVTVIGDWMLYRHFGIFGVVACVSVVFIGIALPVQLIFVAYLERRRRGNGMEAAAGM